MPNCIDNLRLFKERKYQQLRAETNCYDGVTFTIPRTLAAFSIFSSCVEIHQNSFENCDYFFVKDQLKSCIQPHAEEHHVVRSSKNYITNAILDCMSFTLKSLV